MKRPRKPRRRTLVIIAVLVIVVIGAILGWHFLNGPATATPTQGHTGGENAKQAKPDEQLSGHYFSLLYPAGYGKPVDITAQDPNSLEQYRLTQNDHGVTTIVVSISTLPTGGLSEVSSYKLRKIQPTVYTEKTATLGSNQADVMTRADASESTAFVVRGPDLATIAITSNSPNRPAADELQTLASSFQWLQQ